MLVIPSFFLFPELPAFHHCKSQQQYTGKSQQETGKPIPQGGGKGRPAHFDPTLRGASGSGRLGELPPKGQSKTHQRSQQARPKEPQGMEGLGVFPPDCSGLFPQCLGDFPVGHAQLQLEGDDLPGFLVQRGQQLGELLLVLHGLRSGRGGRSSKETGRCPRM